MNYKLAIIIIIFILMSSPSMAMDNAYARIVYNVRGLQDYDLHWNDRFPPGSIMKIYVESNGINHRRHVAVDYVFLIKDANDNIVDTSSLSSKYDDYRENDFVVYSKSIPQSWEDGVYTVQIHVFDLLNDSLMNDYYFNLTESYLNGSGIPDIPEINRSDILGDQNQLINISKTFYVDRYANKYPVDRFRVENIILDRYSVAPKEQIQISFNVLNTFYDKGSTPVLILLDGKEIGNTTIELEGYKSRNVTTIVSSDIVGDHLIEIIPIGPNAMGLNNSAFFSIVPEKIVEKPTSFNIKDLQIDKLSVIQGETVTISVTVENVGKEGSQPVELLINDKLEEQKEVFLNFTETQDVKFNVTKPEPGAYRVSITNTSLSKIFFVESPEQVTNATNISIISIEEKKPELKYIIGLSILIISIVALRLYLKWKLK
ncbi:MAG: hypothetical protein FIB07_02925 [Candidatus Methanoperedens sp.]|nr:hypothetical protein [Candidatus Methanoperedens sp.]